MTTVALQGAGTTRAPFPVFRRSLAEGWRGLLGWSLGLTVVALVYLPLYPSVRTPELVRLMDSMPPALIRSLGYEDITSGAGYAQATFFGLIGFVLITIAGIGWGAAFVAGAEESGRLELTLAHGVGRVQYALESAVALTAKLVTLGLVGWILIWTMNGPAGLDLTPVNILAASTAWVGVGLFSATAALAAGALTGRRIWGIGVGAGVAVTGYVLQAIANNSADLDGLRVISPYDWAFGEAPLANGMDWLGLGLLWGGSALLIALATTGLARRDVLG